MIKLGNMDKKPLVGFFPGFYDMGETYPLIKIAKKYFGEVKYNLPDVANFAAAVNWTWKNAETDYIFHLEDDWQLIQKVPINTLLLEFDKNPNLLQIILRAYRYNYVTCALSPSIIHRRMYSAIGGNLKEDLNPEAQLRGERHGIVMPSRGRKGFPHRGKIMVYPGKNRKIILKDLGRAWIRKTKYIKNGGGKKARFLTWDTKN